MKNSTRSVSQTPADIFASHDGEQPARMTLVMMSDLLQERGYALIHRYEHLHAIKDGMEWHLCLLTDVAALSPSQFLASLDDTFSYRLIS